MAFVNTKPTLLHTTSGSDQQSLNARFAELVTLTGVVAEWVRQVAHATQELSADRARGRQDGWIE